MQYERPKLGIRPDRHDLDRLDVLTNRMRQSLLPGEPGNRAGPTQIAATHAPRVPRNPCGRREQFRQHLPHQGPDGLGVHSWLAGHAWLRSAPSAASAAWRTSASDPDRYTRPVAPIIR